MLSGCASAGVGPRPDPIAPLSCAMLHPRATARPALRIWGPAHGARRLFTEAGARKECSHLFQHGRVGAGWTFIDLTITHGGNDVASLLSRFALHPPPV